MGDSREIIFTCREARVLLTGQLPTVDDLRQAYIDIIIDINGGNRAAAARVLGVSARSLYRKQKRLTAMPSGVHEGYL